MTGDGVRFFSFLAVYVGNYVETDKNASEGVLDILCRIPGASYIFYVFFGRIRGVLHAVWIFPADHQFEIWKMVPDVDSELPSDFEHRDDSARIQGGKF